MIAPDAWMCAANAVVLGRSTRCKGTSRSALACVVALLFVDLSYALVALQPPKLRARAKRCESRRLNATRSFVRRRKVEQRRRDAATASSRYVRVLTGPARSTRCADVDERLESFEFFSTMTFSTRSASLHAGLLRETPLPNLWSQIKWLEHNCFGFVS